MPPRRSKVRWIGAGVAGLLVVGGVAVAARGPSGPDHPDEWDPRVLPLAEFVEQARGLEFEHPVHVDFLDEDEWAAWGEVDSSDLSDEEVEVLEQTPAVFRALGMAEGDFDLLAAVQDVQTDGTVGFYEFATERISVRGLEMTWQVKATLVHELTHVLQDQHFDIGDRLQIEGRGLTDETALHVVAEGDADRIEGLWADQLPDADRAALEAEMAEGVAGAEADLAHVPGSVVALFGSTYVLGAGFVAVVEADDGQDGIDHAFELPPGPEEHVFDPLSYLQLDEPEDVDLPDVDGEVLDGFDGPFGVVGWYLMLAERTDPATALVTLEGWGGDASRAFVRDGRTCIALRYRGEDEAAAVGLEAVATAWAAAMPIEADAVVGRDGDVVEVTSCDPGADAEVIEGDGRSVDLIGLPAIRAGLAAEVLAGGGDPVQARCFASGFVGQIPYELLVSETTTPEQDDHIELVSASMVETCLL
ncbi:MAG: hypothetical protein AB7L84_17170 [Acidimicrobiia bacterium]